MSEVKKISKQELGSLLIYYGWPGEINKAHQTSDPSTYAAREFAHYDYVVLGAGLELNEHANHSLTETIIPHPLCRDTCFFGYIDLGITTSSYTIKEIKKRTKLWAAMKVQGIFLDDFGYDFQVPRQRQNQAVDYAHKQGLPVIACGWEPDHIFAASEDKDFNPKGAFPHLGREDYYLYESYQIINGNYVAEEIWQKKARKLKKYQKQFEFQVLAVTTNDAPHLQDTPGAYTQDKFFYAWYSALLDGWAGIGWGEPSYSANSSAPFRRRPDCDPALSLTTSLEEENGIFYRDGYSLRIWIDPATRKAGKKTKA